MKALIIKWLIPVVAFVGLLVLATQPTFAAYQTLYVDGELIWVDYGTYVHGPIDSPYLTITEAINDLDSDGGRIYVAEGTYPENLAFSNLDDIEILGGYNGGPGDPSPFTSQNTTGNQTKINGAITGVNASGKISGLTFYNRLGISYLISITNSLSHNFEISDNYFNYDYVSSFMVKINSASGGSGVIKDNYFDNAFSDQSVVGTGGAGDTTIENNEFYDCASTNGSYGIITATSGAVVQNNLIANSDSTNRVGIRISNEAEVYNNTVADGSALTAGIASSGSGHTVYNNLVANITGTDYVLSVSATESNNLSDSDCNPNFAGGSGANAYKLGSSSTCVDEGRTVSSASPDFFGTSRPSGSAYDVGFHELVIIPVCGNNIVETGEQCDDGNTVSGDDCSSTCQNETPSAVCGNNIVETGEQCDDGNSSNGDGCSASCDDEPDLCDNIAGYQYVMPSGYVADGSSCIEDDGQVVPCGDWYDINSSDSHYDIAVYLCEHGEIIRGDSFGNLRINDKLTRAELLAMAFRAREYENLGVVDVNAGACFNDVIDGWYAKYFCTAKDEGFIEGYEGNVAKPGNIVLLAEALKMMLGALDKYYSIDSGDCWYCSMVWSAEPHDWLPFTFDSPTDIGPLELDRRYAMDMLYRILTN
jgi:cysteine-rich repeat protein